jgi:hypothetical protein
MAAAGVPAALLLSGMPNFIFMLRCNRTIAAMQTNALSLASGIHKLFPDDEAGFRRN